jgi:hypothetical protein
LRHFIGIGLFGAICVGLGNIGHGPSRAAASVAARVSSSACPLVYDRAHLLQCLGREADRLSPISHAECHLFIGKADLMPASAVRDHQ